MTRMIWGLGLLLVAGVATGGDEKGKGIGKLKGTWINELDGKKHVMKLDGKAFTFTMNVDGKELSVKGTIKIDASKKPKHMDLAIKEAEGEAAKFKDQTALAIFDLDGDTLKWCANEPGKDSRPTEFPDKEGEDKHLYLIFKRGK